MQIILQVYIIVLFCLCMNLYFTNVSIHFFCNNDCKEKWFLVELILVHLKVDIIYRGSYTSVYMYIPNKK